MAKREPHALTRRAFTRTLAIGAAATALPYYARAQAVIEEEEDVTSTAKHNISSFAGKSWEPYFSNRKNGVILVDTVSRALHYWSADQSVYKLYPCSVPLTDELTRRGRTSVIQKVTGPSWAPTPSMKKRNPEWPAYIPPGPDNPL